MRQQVRAGAFKPCRFGRSVRGRAPGPCDGYGGVTSTYVEARADVFGVGPETVIETAETVPLLMDTSMPEACELYEDLSTSELWCLA